MSRHKRRLPAIFAAFVLLSGCGFFTELESADMPGDDDAGTSTDDTGTGGPCTLVDDDYCMDQDTLSSCSVDSGETSIYDCGELCGQYLNFTCLNVGTGQHGCWCVAAGKQKVYSCTELEDCLRGCGGAYDSSCADQCFSRTTSGTIRMFGALIHCAQAGCEAGCLADPGGCGACVNAAQAGESGGCAVERAVCDNDRNDEPWP